MLRENYKAHYESRQLDGGDKHSKAACRNELQIKAVE